MVATKQDTKARVMELLDDLPESALAEVISFVEYQRYKAQVMMRNAVRTTPYMPTPMGGLLKDFDITAEEIHAARKEMWGEWISDEE